MLGFESEFDSADGVVALHKLRGLTILDRQPPKLQRIRTMLTARVFDPKRRLVTNITVLAFGYWAFAALADQLSLAGEVTAIWPASGLAAAAVIVLGFRVWPGILLGVYLNQMTWLIKGREAIAENGFLAEFGHHSLVGLSFGVGNVLEALFIAWLVRPITTTQHHPLEKLRDNVRLLILVPFVGPIVGATVGTAVICGLWQWTPWSDFFMAASTWWISAVAGILIVLPPLLWLDVGKNNQIESVEIRRFEFVLLCICFLLVLGLTFRASLPIEYLLLLVLLWSAFRFGQSVTAWLGAAMAFAAIYATINGYGPFISGSSRELTVNQTVTLLQCFISALILTALLLAAVVAEWRRNQRDLVASNETLELRVAERTAELNLAKDAAEKANAAKSRFFAAASHDLRQPLHAMTFFIDALLIDLKKTDRIDSDGQEPVRSAVRSNNHTETVNKLRRTVDNMRDLFDGILDLSKIDADTLGMSRSSFPLSDVLQQLDREYGPAAQQLGLTWHCDSTNSSVFSDPILLERVLRNVLDNAFKFTQHGGVSIELESTQDEAVISIRDTGPGIPTDKQSAIFEEFYQIADEKRRGEKGLGLGLSIVRKLCELLDHQLHLESAAGSGTTVRLSVPLGVQTPSRDNVAELTPRATTFSETSTPETARVLIIDDNEIVIEATHSLLTRWGYDVRVAETETDMANCLGGDWQPQIAIVDYKLDRSNALTGLEVLDRLYEHLGAEIPSLIVSADTQPDFLKTIKERKIQLLTKPLKPAQLRSMLRASLRE